MCRPSDRIAMGFIGLGGHGIGRNLNMFLGQADAQPVVFCDVDSSFLDKAMQTTRQRRGDESFSCPTTGDWREVIARDDVDAVMISTPDHWHVPMSVAAMRAGKDVISEKPTLTIAEGRTLVETVGTVWCRFSVVDRRPVAAGLSSDGRTGTQRSNRQVAAHRRRTAVGARRARRSDAPPGSAEL